MTSPDTILRPPWLASTLRRMIRMADAPEVRVARLLVQAIEASQIPEPEIQHAERFDLHLYQLRLIFRVNLFCSNDPIRIAVVYVDRGGYVVILRLFRSKPSPPQTFTLHEAVNAVRQAVDWCCGDMANHEPMVDGEVAS